jgi:hypothetical protein
MVMHALLTSLTTSQRSNPWYDNGWLIGTVTGLASGILLATFTPLFLRKRRARDLAIRRDRAADDLLASLRPSVATGTLPSASTVEAVARACAYQRGLDPKLATSTLTLLDVLVSEVMVSAFLAPDIRVTLSNKVLSLRSELDNQPAFKRQLDTRNNFRAVTIFASVLGAAAIGGASAVSVITSSWIPVATIVLVGTFLLTIYMLGDRITRFKIGPTSLEFETMRPVIREYAVTDGASFDASNIGRVGGSPSEEPRDFDGGS